jgi:Zn-dependent protease/predicted transcriptional regulator
VARVALETARLFLADFSHLSGHMDNRTADGTPSEALLPSSLAIGRVAGIHIGLHYSWFVLAALITLSLVNHFRATNPEWTTGVVWSGSALTAVLFFATLLAHELSHALVAKARDLPVRSITLFALGGLARIEKRANTAATEVLVAVVGPITSATIGVLCVGIARSMGWTPQSGSQGMIAAVLGWLGSINLVLAFFNLIPGYPLDGGRIFRGILWGMYQNETRATTHALRVGQVVAGGFIALGLWRFLLGAGFGGLWLAFIGWFLLSASHAEYRQLTLGDTLRGVRVADLMAHDCATVDPATDVQTLVDEVLLKTGRRCVMVQTDGHVLGLVTPNDIRQAERSRWRELSARQVMRPLDRLKTVTPDTSALDALTTMGRDDLSQLPVMVGGRLEGLVTRSRILQLLESRMALKPSR